jgi:hypothetical protein
MIARLVKAQDRKTAIAEEKMQIQNRLTA